MAERFYTPEPEPTSDIGTAESLFVVGSTVGQKAYHPEFRVNNDDDPNFDFKTYVGSLPEEDRMTVATARNETYANNLLARKQNELEALKNVDALPWYGKYPGLMATGMVDPVNLIPISGVLAKTAGAWKTYDKMSRITKAATIGAGAGMVSNVASESLMGAQGMDTNYVSSAFLGTRIGGGLGSIAGILSHPIEGPKLSKLLVDNNDYLDHLEVDPNVSKSIKVSPGSSPLFKTGVPKAPDGGPLFVRFLKSDAQLMAEHADENVRAFGYMMASPTNAAKDAAGNPIAIKDTAWDRVTQWSGDKQNTDAEVTQLFTEAVNSDYKGNFDGFQKEISTSYREAAGEQKRMVAPIIKRNLETSNKELKAEFNTAKEGLDEAGVKKLKEEFKVKKEEARLQIIDEAYTNTPITFKGQHPSITKGAEVYRQYYTKHLDRMKQLGMEEMKGISSNRLYMPRVYNNERIRQLDANTLRDTIRQAIKADPANEELIKSAKGLEAVVDDLSKTLKNIAAKESYLDYSYIAPKELPLASHLKQMKVKLDDSTMGDLLLQDAQNLAGLYSYKMTRQQAIQYKFGTTDLDKIREVYIKPVEESLIASGGDMKILQNMENGFKDLIGTLRMSPDGSSLSHTFSRVTGAYDSLTYGGSFGFNNIAEIPAAMWATGFKDVFSSQYSKSLGAVKDLLFKETKAGNWEFANELISLGHMTDALRASNAQRMTDMDQHFSAKSFEKGLNKATETMFKYNGLRASTAALEAIVSSNAVSDIPRLSKALLSGSISSTDKARLARWGLDATDTHKLAKTIEESATFKNGKLEELGLEKWDQADVDSLSVMVNRVISESIIQADTVHLPTWMKVPAPMTKLLTRFLRYPIAAHGILLQRGWTDDRAGLASNIVGGIMVFGMFKYLQEQAQVAVGAKADSETKFDIINDDEAWSRLITKSMNYSGGMGVTTVILDHAMTLTGQEQLGTEYRQGGLSLLGPTASRIENIQTLGRALGEGEWTGTKDYNALKSWIPGATMPLVKEALDATSEAWGLKR